MAMKYAQFRSGARYVLREAYYQSLIFGFPLYVARTLVCEYLLYPILERLSSRFRTRHEAEAMRDLIGRVHRRSASRESRIDDRTRR